jgi:hypothetical protein
MCGKLTLRLARDWLKHFVAVRHILELTLDDIVTIIETGENGIVKNLHQTPAI